MDLNAVTFMNLVFDVLEELIRDGVKKVLILNGHYENEAFILEAVDLISRKYEDVKIVEGSWWDQVSQHAMDKVSVVEFPGWDLEHAAIRDISLFFDLNLLV